MFRPRNGGGFITPDFAAPRREPTEEDFRPTRTELESLAESRVLRRLTLHLLQNQDNERRKIARELHDGLGQYLTALKINLEQMRKGADPHQLLADSIEIIDQAISETRTMSHLLHPPLLDEMGFTTAAQWYVEGFAKRSGIDTKTNFPSDLEHERLDPLVELALFRILQECLTNVHRHSGASAAEVDLRLDAESVYLSITDNGKGMSAEMLGKFRARGANAGVGLAGMQERLADLGGHLKIDSDASGTTVLVTIPITRAVA